MMNKNDNLISPHINTRAPLTYNRELRPVFKQFQTDLELEDNVIDVAHKEDNS
jgi:regulator of sigma D